METLSLREMIWLAHSSAWASPSLGRRSGANPWIVHAEYCAGASKWGQWSRYSAWSEERIGAVPGLSWGAGMLGAASVLPVHAERCSVRIGVPHGISPESLRARA